MYDRSRNEDYQGESDKAAAVLGSSGFEHVFIGECCKGGTVGGFHNWFHWYTLEQVGRDETKMMGHSLVCRPGS